MANLQKTRLLLQAALKAAEAVSALTPTLYDDIVVRSAAAILRRIFDLKE